jgi:hypothetical protein
MMLDRSEHSDIHQRWVVVNSFQVIQSDRMKCTGFLKLVTSHQAIQLRLKSPELLQLALRYLPPLLHEFSELASIDHDCRELLGFW